MEETSGLHSGRGTNNLALAWVSFGQVQKHARPLTFLQRLHSSQSTGGFFSSVPKGDKA